VSVVLLGCGGLCPSFCCGIRQSCFLLPLLLPIAEHLLGVFNQDILPILINILRKGVAKGPSPGRRRGGEGVEDYGQVILLFTSCLCQAPRSRYIWLEELGRGRFGTTYLVQHKETGEHFAVKQISKTQPSFKPGRILTEVKVHATLKDHPNVAGGYLTKCAPVDCAGRGHLLSS
jgi:hypothetical protein